MPVIDVISSPTSGRSAAASSAKVAAAGTFDAILTGQLASDDTPSPADGITARELAVGTDATHEAIAVGADDAREAVAAAPGRPPRSPVPGASSQPAVDHGTIAPPLASALLDPSADGGDANGRDGVASVSTPAAASSPLPAAVSPPATHPRLPATFVLGGGPVLAAAVADAVTLASDDAITAPNMDPTAAHNRADAAPLDAEDSDGGSVALDADGVVAQNVSLTASPTIVATGTAPANDKTAGAKAAVEATGTNMHAVATMRLGHAASPDSAASRAEEKEAVTLARSSDGIVDANPRSGAAPHHAGHELAAPAPATVALPQPGTTTAITPGALPSSAPTATALATGSPETAALHHLERLYAPHDTGPSTGGFARFGTIGQDTGVAIARGVTDGRDHITLRLDPPDLGRIDVQLSFSPDGGVRAVVASDNRAALDLLRRDLGQLHQALADAGVRADAGSFHFSERQSGGGQHWDTPTAGDYRTGPGHTPIATELTSPILPSRGLRSSGLIDVYA